MLQQIHLYTVSVVVKIVVAFNQNNFVTECVLITKVADGDETLGACQKELL